MRIGELAKQSKLSIETLRYYEQAGLMDTPLRLENGYRDYTHASLTLLKFIKRAKQAGFSLKEIRSLISFREAKDQHTLDEVKTLGETKLAEIEAQILHLQTMHKELKSIVQACCGGTASAQDCVILSALEPKL
ncbi:MAG: heavy metal-responsive transcriptional regulator [Arenicellales bacterium]